MAYNAIITTITTKPHPNADRIQLGLVLGNQVIVGLNVKDGDRGVYFPPDGIISHQFALRNNLYNKAALVALGLEDTGKYGFFDAHRRVRVQKFRGERSEGLWLPITSLDGTFQSGVDCYDVGYSFDHWGGVRICEKWESKATKQRQSQTGRSVKKGELPTFPKHMDTEQWRYMWENIPAESLLTVTEKLHGTSHRVTVIKEDRPWWKFWAKPKLVRVDGSRNVIINESSGGGYYGDDQFRFNAVHTAPRLGEVLYGEIVGYMTYGNPIMTPAKVDKKDLPDVHDTYGSGFDWSYDQNVGQCEFFIYRIVQFCEDGHGIELSYHQMVKRAHQLGYRTPPLISQTFMTDPSINPMVEQWSDGPSIVDPGHIREGVVIRVDSPSSTYYLKNKSFAFKLIEGIIKSDDSIVDMEEAS